MDFSKVNIIKILKSAIPNRFQDFPPNDFEDFICQIFKDNGYKVEHTSYIGDYGADMILRKTGERIAVQVKRYSKDNKVSVSDVNQILGAKNYYNCETARIITTSSLTKPAKNLAEKTLVEIWDWDKFQKYICDTYLKGKNFYEYYQRENEEENTKLFEFEIKSVLYKQPMKNRGNYTLIHVNMKNLTDKNITLDLKYPIYITKNKQQIEANYWYEGYFSRGTIYAGCSVEIAFMFKSEQLSTVTKEDIIIFQWYNENNETVSQQYIVKYSKCYIVTLLYGNNSKEYFEMINFRDNYLINFSIGRSIIRFYYSLSPKCIKKFEKFKSVKTTLKIFISIILYLIKIMNIVNKKI